MVDFHMQIRDEQHARNLLEVCAKEIEARTRLKILNKPSVRIAEEMVLNPNWYSAYMPHENAIVLKKGADGTNIVHELIHANTDRSGGYDFSENIACYFTFLVCESLHKGERPPKEDNIRDFLRGIATMEKLRGLLGEKLFGLLVTDFYKGLNEILKAVTGEELDQLEIDILRFLVGWAYWRHITLELYKFTEQRIAKELRAKKEDVSKALKRLKKLGLLYACNSLADSVLRDRVYELCEQYAKTKNTPLSFFYR